MSEKPLEQPAFKNRPNRPIDVDGETVWISRSVTVVLALLFAKDRQMYVPLQKRGVEMPFESGKWGLPGGYLDFDETAGEAIIREVYEELGLYLPTLMDTYPWIGDLEQPYHVESRPLYAAQNVSLRFPMLIAVEALPVLAPVVGLGEVEETRWFPVEEAIATSLAFGHDTIIRQCLEVYYRWKQEGDRTLEIL
jgi:8-oxo-dGTP pyrophosphatase MutT (NUDIX family)